jgi:hypothetical protein
VFPLDATISISAVALLDQCLYFVFTWWPSSHISLTRPLVRLCAFFCLSHTCFKNLLWVAFFIYFFLNDLFIQIRDFFNHTGI